MITDYFKKTFPCLCGKGTVVHSGWSNDYRSDDAWKLECADCKNKYEGDGEYLWDKEIYKKTNECFVNLISLQAEELKIRHKAAVLIVAPMLPSFTHMTQEFQWLVNKNILNKTTISKYRKTRKDISFIDLVADFLDEKHTDNAVSSEMKEKISELSRIHEELRKKLSESRVRSVPEGTRPISSEVS